MTVAAATQERTPKKRGARRPPIPVALNSALSAPIIMVNDRIDSQTSVKSGAVLQDFVLPGMLDEYILRWMSGLTMPCTFWNSARTSVHLGWYRLWRAKD